MADYLADAQRLAEIDTEIGDLLVQVDDLKGERAALEKTLLVGWATGEIETVRTRGRTVYLHHQFWASMPKGSDRAQACAALEEAGVGQFVEPNFNFNTVSGWIRGLEADKDGVPILPPELEGRLAVREEFKIRTRRTS